MWNCTFIPIRIKQNKKKRKTEFNWGTNLVPSRPDLSVQKKKKKRSCRQKGAIPCISYGLRALCFVKLAATFWEPSTTGAYIIQLSELKGVLKL